MRVCVCSVPEFEATKFPVTNREFLQFVENGGYTKTELWTEEGGLRSKTAVATNDSVLRMFGSTL